MYSPGDALLHFVTSYTVLQESSGPITYLPLWTNLLTLNRELVRTVLTFVCWTEWNKRPMQLCGFLHFSDVTTLLNRLKVHSDYPHMGCLKQSLHWYHLKKVNQDIFVWMRCRPPEPWTEVLLLLSWCIADEWASCMQRHTGWSHRCLVYWSLAGGRRSFGNDRGVLDDTGGDGYDDEERMSGGCGRWGMGW